MIRLVAASLAILAVATAAHAAPRRRSPAPVIADTSTFTVAGPVTHVEPELGFFVVTPSGVDVVVACPPKIAPGCAPLAVGDVVQVGGHFGPPAEACSGDVPFYAPLVVDSLWRCADGGKVCEQLAG